MFFTDLETGQSNTVFTFASSTFIPSGSNTTSKKSTSLIFYLHFSSFIYKSFSSTLFNISATNSSCLSSVSISTIISSTKLPTFPVFIKSLGNLFIMAWNMASEFVNPKNITVGSNNLSGVVKAVFHSSLYFILILLYPHLKSIFVNIFLVPIVMNLKS